MKNFEKFTLYEDTGTVTSTQTISTTPVFKGNSVTLEDTRTGIPILTTNLPIETGN